MSAHVTQVRSNGDPYRMRWLALTFGSESCASTHFRIHQYVRFLSEQGVELDCRPAAELDAIKDFHGYDGILLQKKLLSWRHRNRVKKSGLPLVFDIDDATWHPLERAHHPLTRWRTAHRLRSSLGLASTVLAANEYLAAHLRRFHSDVRVIPMTLPSAEWQPRTFVEEPLVIGWAGAPANHFQLRHIESALQATKQSRPDVVIRIFSGVKPDLDVDIDFVPFHPDQQVRVLRSFSIGLLPLPNTPFNHGKSPIKALQYMATGIPCVASPLAGTVEMLGEGGGAVYASSSASWSEGLLRIAGDTELMCRMGHQNRSRFESHYTTEAVAECIAACLRQNSRNSP